MYALMLLVTTVVSCLMLVPSIQKKIEEDKWFVCDTVEGTTGLDCKHATGYQVRLA